jgi:PepSY-associated TM region
MVKRSSLRPLILLHRYFGVAFCLLFAMWFASGIVMHFVPFPALSESDRIAALLPIDLTRVNYSPAQAVAASEIGELVRVRLIQRADVPVYIVSSSDKTEALRATDLGDAGVRSAETAVVLAAPRERHSHLENMSATIAMQIWADQWTVSQQYDPHRPLYRVPLNDPAGTDRYVSGATGEIVLTSTRGQRWWNYLGSVAHWIYAVPLRKHLHVWTEVLRWLAFLASVAVGLGAAIGISRIGLKGLRLASPYGGLQAWHHWFGLICLPFVFTWIISGWFSLDEGQLFSSGKLTRTQVQAITGRPDWQSLPPDELRGVSATAHEVEWFAFNGRIYRRELFGPDAAVDASATTVRRAFLRPDEIDLALRNLREPCDPSFAIDGADEYAAISTMPHAPVFRAICAANWFHVDGSNGVIIEQLDRSRRAYRWLFAGLHTLNFPFLAAHSALRTVLIVFFCGCGFVFSVTGIVLAQRRIRSLWWRS